MPLKLVENKKNIIVELPDAHAHGDVRYESRLLICDSPTCDCNEVTVQFIPIDSSGKEDRSLESKEVVVDLIDHKIKSAPEGKPDKEFNKLFEAHVGEEFYLALSQQYLKYKQQLTQQADLASLEINFPIEEIERNDLMVAYIDVLPFGKSFHIQINGQEMLMLDHYCVKMGCSCMDVAIYFEPLDESDKSTIDYPSYMIHYKKRRWKHADEDDKKPGPAGKIKTLKESIEAAYPQFYSELQQRHSTLKMLYSNCLKAKGIGIPKVSEKNVGRNEPCPCGSGKKYKKCCLNKA